VGTNSGKKMTQKIDIINEYIDMLTHGHKLKVCEPPGRDSGLYSMSKEDQEIFVEALRVLASCQPKRERLTLK
jgi:hypothetical protein